METVGTGAIMSSSDYHISTIAPKQSYLASHRGTGYRNRLSRLNSPTWLLTIDTPKKKTVIAFLFLFIFSLLWLRKAIIAQMH